MEFDTDYTLVDGETVLINSDKCTDIGCGFTTLLPLEQFPKEVDDVVVYSSNPSIPKFIVLSQQLNVKSLNLTSGFLKIDSGGSLKVQSNLLMTPNGALTISSNVTVNIGSNFACQGRLMVEGGMLSIGGELNVTGNFSMSSGSIELGGLYISEIIDDYTVFTGGTLKISGTTIIDSGLTMKGNSQLIVNSGSTSIYGGFDCRDKTLVNVVKGSLLIGGYEPSIITSALVLGADTALNISGPNVKIRGSIVNKYSASQIFINPEGKLELSGKANLLAKVIIEKDGTLAVYKGTCSLTSFETHQDALIKIGDNGSLNMLGRFDIKSQIEIDTTGSLIIDGTTSITGNISDHTGSVIHIIGGDCTIFNNNSQLIIKSDVLVDNKSSLSMSGNLTLFGNLVFSDTSHLNIAPKSIVNFGGSNTKILVDITLESSTVVNCLSNSTTLIQRIIQSDNTSTINIDHLASLTFNDGCTILTPIKLRGNSSLYLSGESNVSTIHALTIDNQPLPLVYLLDCRSCLLRDQKMELGVLSVDRSIVEIIGKIDILEMLNTDSESLITVGEKSTLSLFGDGSNLDSKVRVKSGGKFLIDGNTDLFGIEIGENALFAVNSSAIVNIEGDCSFRSPLIATGNAILNLKTGCQFFKGVKIPTNSTVLNIYGSPEGENVFFYGNTTINSAVTCGTLAHITIPPESYCEFNWGLTLAEDTDLNVIGSTCVISRFSKLQGRTILSNSSTLITNTKCLFYGGIQSLDKMENTLVINSGYTTLDFETKISGNIIIRPGAQLYVNTPITCNGVVKNDGYLKVNAMFDITGSSYEQDSNDALLVLNQAQISAKSVNIISGKMEGDGTIATSSGFTNGGVIDGVFKVNGQLKLLDTSLLIIDINSTSDYNKILVSTFAVLDGMVSVNVNETAKLKLNDKLPILSAGGLTGQLSLADSKYSKSFKLNLFGPIYNLVYQSTTSISMKDQTTTGSFALKLSNSFTLLIICLFITIFNNLLI